MELSESQQDSMAKISRCDMEVRLLKGGTAKLRLSNKRLRAKGKSKSQFQYEVGQRLAAEYPHDMIFEEVRVPGDGFILDFFIPSLDLVIECHGRQHTEHVKHFHKTKVDFHKQQDIDQRKRDFCKLNGFRLVEIYDE
jgi:very-short-patch-repair endonuclease